MISTAHTITSGMLMRKIRRQDPMARSSPPSRGPTTPAIVPHAVQLPIAPPRSDSGKVCTITASDAGVSSALATPCSARAPIRNPMLGEIAHRIEAAPKPITPIAKIRRSP